MSTFDDASLVFIPSGYKTSKAYSVKPIDGTGDLTFTRSNDTATRVNSAGLIEKVRTNLVLQSNSFNTTWTASNASVTSGQAGYDGTNNAWLLSKSAANGYISQGPASSGNETISVYAKAGTDNWLHILVRDSASVFFGGYWDLQNGVVGSAIGATTLRIESVGNGWYRCSASFVKSTSNYYRIYPAEGNNDTSGTSGNILIQNAQLEAGDIATQPILTTTAAVSVGPVANVPRLDYLNSSCPRLLLEPQRTNLALYSEQFDNAGWTKENATITANAVSSPSGYQDADTLTDNSTNGRHRVSQIMSATNGTTYTYSVFVKKNSSGRFLLINAATLINARAALNLDTLAITNINGTGKVEDYGNGWYRFSVTGTATATSSTATYIQMQNSASDVNYVGNGSSFYLWGAQLEAGAHASSYINTLNSAVTRGADSMTKSAISGLIGQTEGVIFMDFVYSTPEQTRININSGSSQNWVFFGAPESVTSSRVYIRASGIVSVDTTTNLTGVFVVGQRYKVALAYKSGDWAIAINGTIRTSGTQTFTFNAPLTTAIFSGNVTSEPSAQQGTNNVNQALLFKTRLSNSDLAAITTL